MDWALTYYTKQSETFATGVVTDSHRAIANRLRGWCDEIDGGRRVLELGAGMGGTAAALADLGFDVWAVEFNPSDAALARQLASERTGSLTIVEADFYDVQLAGTFDFVFYWDGFGIGDDDDQRRLLHRIGHEWLAARGRGLIDVFSPWNWRRRDGETSVYTARDGRQWERGIEFDVAASRLIDHWEPLPERDEHRSQSLACYTLPEFEALVDGSGLRVSSFIGMDGRALTRGDPNAYLRETNGFLAMIERADVA